MLTRCPRTGRPTYRFARSIYIWADNKWYNAPDFCYHCRLLPAPCWARERAIANKMISLNFIVGLCWSLSSFDWMSASMDCFVSMFLSRSSKRPSARGNLLIAPSSTVETSKMDIDRSNRSSLKGWSKRQIPVGFHAGMLFAGLNPRGWIRCNESDDSELP